MANGNTEPSQWLDCYNLQVKPHNSAGFVEYLRWMRCPSNLDDDDTLDNALKTKLLQEAARQSSGYRQWYEKRDRNLEEIVGAAIARIPWLTEDNSFLTVQGNWRVRVGGQRGPESILLPAFDALGMPYFPSSTLRGVARAAALEERWQSALKNCNDQPTTKELQAIHEQVEKEIARYFGALDAPKEHQAGKVMFLDAYPTPKQWRNNLAVDIANNIWKWENNKLNYKSNPNVFLSLKNVRFRIGLCPTIRCSQAEFLQVRDWLIQGLHRGIGSQVNSGYGAMEVKQVTASAEPRIQIQFTLAGQLAHGYQFMKWNRNKERFEGEAEPEIRPIAFKSMLRYWFRVLSLGFIDPGEVQQQWEPLLFGGIDPQTQGWLRFYLSGDRNPKSSTPSLQMSCPQQSGRLCIDLSSQVHSPSVAMGRVPQPPSQTIIHLMENSTCIIHLMENLTWLMFHLGGVGQGARRPLYSRKERNNPKPPYYRGTALEVTQGFSELPNTLSELHAHFREKLQSFYTQLAHLTNRNPFQLTNLQNYRQTLPTHEVFRKNCRVVLCRGEIQSREEKPKSFSLKILHREAFQGTNSSGMNLYDSELCGDSKQNPSPVWIKNLGDYQVVTVFDCTGKRQNFVETLRQEATEFQEIWNNRGLV